MQRRWTVMPTGELQDKKSSLAIFFARGLNSRLSQVTRPSRQPTLFWKTWFFAFHSHSSINTPHTHEILRASRERNPREKQDWLIHNLHIETLQIPLLSSSPLLHPWEVHYQNLFSPYPHLWEGHLVLRKQLGRDQFHIGWCYGL